MASQYPGYPKDAVYGLRSKPVGHLYFTWLKDDKGKTTAGHYELLVPKKMVISCYRMKYRITWILRFPSGWSPLRTRIIWDSVSYNWLFPLFGFLQHYSNLETFVPDQDSGVKDCTGNVMGETAHTEDTMLFSGNSGGCFFQASFLSNRLLLTVVDKSGSGNIWSLQCV